MDGERHSSDAVMGNDCDETTTNSEAKVEMDSRLDGVGGNEERSSASVCQQEGCAQPVVDPYCARHVPSVPSAPSAPYIKCIFVDEESRTRCSNVVDASGKQRYCPQHCMYIDNALASSSPSSPSHSLRQPLSMHDAAMPRTTTKKRPLAAKPTGGVLGRPKIKPARHIPALVIHSPNTAVEETSQSDRKRTRQEQSASDGGDVLQQRTPALSSDSLLLPHSEAFLHLVKRRKMGQSDSLRRKEGEGDGLEESKRSLLGVSYSSHESEKLDVETLRLPNTTAASRDGALKERTNNVEKKENGKEKEEQTGMEDVQEKYDGNEKVGMKLGQSTRATECSSPQKEAVAHEAKENEEDVDEDLRGWIKEVLAGSSLSQRGADSSRTGVSVGDLFPDELFHIMATSLFLDAQDDMQITAEIPVVSDTVRRKGMKGALIDCLRQLNQGYEHQYLRLFDTLNAAHAMHWKRFRHGSTSGPHSDHLTQAHPLMAQYPPIQRIRCRKAVKGEEAFGYDWAIRGECRIKECHNPLLPSSSYCLPHILCDTKQSLFIPCCSPLIGVPGKRCGFPVLNTLTEYASCPVHREFADEIPILRPTEDEKSNLLERSVALARCQQLTNRIAHLRTALYENIERRKHILQQPVSLTGLVSPNVIQSCTVLCIGMNALACHVLRDVKDQLWEKHRVCNFILVGDEVVKENHLQECDWMQRHCIGEPWARVCGEWLRGMEGSACQAKAMVTSTTVQGSVLRRNPSLLASVDVVVAFNPNKEADKDTAHLCSQAILPYIRVLTPSSGYKGTIVSMHSQLPSRSYWLSADVTAASGTRAEGNNNSVPLLYSVPISLKTLSHRASCLRDNNGQHGKTGNARTTDETEDDAARASVISEHWVTTLAVGHWKAFEELVDSISSVLPSKTVTGVNVFLVALKEWRLQRKAKGMNVDLRVEHSFPPDLRKIIVELPGENGCESALRIATEVVEHCKSPLPQHLTEVLQHLERSSDFETFTDILISAFGGFLRCESRMPVADPKSFGLADPGLELILKHLGERTHNLWQSDVAKMKSLVLGIFEEKKIRLCVSEDLLSQRILSFCAVLSRLHCDIREETADDDCKYQSLWTRFARHASLPLDEQGIINHGEGSMHDSVPKSCEAGDTTQIRPGDMDILGAVMIARAKCLVEQAQVGASDGVFASQSLYQKVIDGLNIAKNDHMLGQKVCTVLNEAICLNREQQTACSSALRGEAATRIVHVLCPQGPTPSTSIFAIAQASSDRILVFRDRD